MQVGVLLKWDSSPLTELEQSSFMSFLNKGKVIGMFLTLGALALVLVFGLGSQGGSESGEVIVFHNKGLDAYSRHLLSATKFSAPGLAGKEDLVRLVKGGVKEAVFAKCDSIVEVEARGLCFINVGEALFVLHPDQLSSNIKFCESFSNTFKIELNRSPAVVCVAGLIQHYLIEFSLFHGSSIEDNEIFNSFGRFCLTLEEGSKRACVQELALFSSSKGFLAGEKSSFFELCESFKDVNLNAVCTVGMGRSFITDKNGKVGVINAEVFGSCLAIKSEQYRSRCLTVIGSMDPNTQLDKIVTLCSKDRVDEWSLCRFYLGVIEYGRAHGVIEDALKGCNLMKVNKLGRDCRIGVLMGQISLNFKKVEYQSMQMFIKRENITLSSSEDLKDELVLAAILTAQGEDLTILKDDIYVLRKICKGFTESCDEAVGVVYKNYKVPYEEFFAFCETASCRQGYREGLS